MNDPLAYDYGYATANNSSRHIIQAEPDDLEPAVLDGHKGSEAVERYRTDSVKAPEQQSSKSGGGGSGGGNSGGSQ